MGAVRRAGGSYGGTPAYVNATSNIHPDQPAYISGNTRDERSHADFLIAPTWFRREPRRSIASRSVPSREARRQAMTNGG
jgi:hypothetical protein